ncbi:MAG TPA: polysaccharide biosynthesis C-terminal domain-containing protein [Thermoleophilia bacterium]|nr:polysaccharide biosynthesis C-terminal domain-containing protein [Thermoleophilia bacterium]
MSTRLRRLFHRPPVATPSTRLRSLFSDSMVYGLGAIASKVVGVLLLPIYVRPEFAGREAFGESDLVVSAITAVQILLTMGISSGLARFTLGDPSRDDWKPVIRTIFVWILTVSTIACLLGAVFTGPIGGALHTDRRIVLIALAGLWVSMNYDVMIRIFRVERKPMTVVFFSLINVVLTVGGTVALVIVIHLRLEGILIANFAGNYVVYAMMLVSRRHTIGFTFDVALFRRIAAFSLPLMPAGLALWALNFADRFQVRDLAQPASQAAGLLGSYSVAGKIALGIMLVVGAFQTAWPSYAFSLNDDAAAKRMMREVFSYWTVLTCWALVAATMASAPYVKLALAPNVADSLPVIPLLMAGTVLYGAFLVVNQGVGYSMRTRMTPLVTTGGAAVNIGLNFWLIPHYGIVGAGVSTVIGYAALVLFGWLNAQRSFPVQYDWSRVLRIAAATTVLVGLSLWAIPDTGAVGIGLRVIAAAAFPFVLAAIGAITPAERARLRALLQRGLGGRQVGQAG